MSAGLAGLEHSFASTSITWAPCRRCGGIDGYNLTTHCPGSLDHVLNDPRTLQQVIARELDFIDGEWIEGKLEIAAALVAWRMKQYGVLSYIPSS